VHALRVLVNLVENAAKYAPGSAPIELTAERDGPTIAIRVSDRGPGIPPHDVARVFEPFNRTESRAPDVGGSGLGLSIARRLAELQGGSLTHEERVGGGSVFTLRLPAADLTPMDQTLPPATIALS
jgi:signal transduction histidine kinase